VGRLFFIVLLFLLIQVNFVQARQVEIAKGALKAVFEQSVDDEQAYVVRIKKTEYKSSFGIELKPYVQSPLMTRKNAQFLQVVDRLQHTFITSHLTHEQARKLRMDSRIESMAPICEMSIIKPVSVDVLKATKSSNDPFVDYQYSVNITELGQAWEKGYTGSSAYIVAMTDSGIDSAHPDLRDNLLSLSMGQEDGMGHGTHVGGIIGAVGNNGIGISGVNWDATVASYSIFDQQGTATESTICDAALRAIEEGAITINMSLSGPFYSDYFKDCLDYVMLSGVSIVVAAGNDFIDSRMRSPAMMPGVITVGASNEDDFLAYFSNYGPQNWVQAPGEYILSTYPTTLVGGEDLPYAWMSGTSMATPMVAGMDVWLKSINPDLNAYQRKQIIRQSGDDKYFAYQTIEKRINFDKAIDWALDPVGHGIQEHRSVNSFAKGVLERAEYRFYEGELYFLLRGWLYDPDRDLSEEHGFRLFVSPYSWISPNIPLIFYSSWEERPDLEDMGIVPHGAMVGFSFFFRFPESYMITPELVFAIHGEDIVGDGIAREHAALPKLAIALDTNLSGWKVDVENERNMVYGWADKPKITYRGNNPYLSLRGWASDLSTAQQLHQDLRRVPVELYVDADFDGDGEYEARSKLASAVADLERMDDRFCLDENSGCTTDGYQGYEFVDIDLHEFKTAKSIKVFVLAENRTRSGEPEVEELRWRRLAFKGSARKEYKLLMHDPIDFDEDRWRHLP
jgi:hypothetical protein